MMRFRVVFLLLFIPLVAGTAIGGYLGIARGTPTIEELRRRTVPGTKIFADDNSLIAEISAQKSMYVPLRKMPEHLINAVVAVEDSRYFKHKGIDYIAIARAALMDIYYREVRQGGSTITQQLAKITFLSPEKTIKRKLREAALAIKIEKNLSKEEILELYLNRIYLGHGAHGVEMASTLYFGKPVSQIGLAEAALLAGLIRGPSNYSPFINAQKARERQTLALQRMHHEGYISQAEMQEALKKPLRLSTRRPPSESFQYFIDYVKRYLEKKYGPEKLYGGEFRVYTTLDKDLQTEAQAAVREGLRELDKRRGWRGSLRRIPESQKEAAGGDGLSLLPSTQEVVEAVVLEVSSSKATLGMAGRTGTLLKEDALWARKVLEPGGKTRFIEDFGLTKILKPGDVVLVRAKPAAGKTLMLSLEQEPQVEGALVAMDPQTGFIRAMTGGYDYRQSEFNRALYARRQAGSAFKPIIYAAALNEGVSPSAIIVDEPITFAWAGGKWEPQNYDRKFAGPTSLREALAHSRNIVTVKLLNQMGIDTALDFARQLGVTAPMPRNLSLALGSLSITPTELLCAYAPFSNGGLKITPIAVKYVTDSKGRVLESNEPPSVQAISPEISFLATSMLQDVVNYGTGYRAKALGANMVAGKTGTTNDYRDAWFMGYNTNLLAGVWVGFDDMAPLGTGETGSRAALPIWVSFMRYAMSKSPPAAFPPPPEGIVSYTVDAATGAVVEDPGDTSAPVYKEYFKKGAEPDLEEQPLAPLQPKDTQPEEELFDFD